MAKLIQVIEHHERRGSGTAEDPRRTVRQFWSVDGDLLMERDSWLEESRHLETTRTITQMIKNGDLK